MIIVDSSALVAVFFGDPEKSAFQAIIDGTDRCLLSAVNAHETACVLRGKLGPEAVALFWRWLADNSVEVAPFNEAQVRAAADAFDRFGLRRRHCERSEPRGCERSSATDRPAAPGLLRLWLARTATKLEPGRSLRYFCLREAMP